MAAITYTHFIVTDTVHAVVAAIMWLLLCTHIIVTDTVVVETAADGDCYQPVNEEPVDVEHALLEVSTGCNDHIALIKNNGTESDVLYEIIIGRTTDSAVIIHPSPAAASAKGESYDVSRQLLISASCTH